MATLRFQSAGHPPPILAPAGQPVEVCEHGRTGILGSPISVPLSVEHEVALAPGDMLVVFTDGLFERRDRGYDEGLAELVQIVTNHRADSVDAIADSLMREARPAGGWQDDVALLVARRPSKS